MKLLINGCSYAELWGGKDLAKDLNLNLINLSKSGASNSRIFRTTIDYILENNDIDTVILMLTFWDREEIRINDNYYDYSSSGFMSSSPEELTEDYEKYIMNRYRYDFDNEQCVVNLLGRVLITSAWLKSKNIKHVIFSAPGGYILPREQRKNILKLEEACRSVSEIIDVRWSSNQCLGDNGKNGLEPELPSNIRHYDSSEYGPVEDKIKQWLAKTT